MTPPLHPRLPPESGDVKATVAVLSFILSSAAKHSVDGESLSSELQQLGLPKGMGTTYRWVTPGPRGAGQRSGCVTLGRTLLSLGQEPETCALSHLSSSPHLLAQGTSFRPQSTRPASVAATRRSRAPCRSACGPAACGVSAGWARVGAGLHSGRCLWLGRCLSSERILNRITSSSHMAGIPGSSQCLSSETCSG